MGLYLTSCLVKGKDPARKVELKLLLGLEEVYYICIKCVKPRSSTAT